MYRTYWILLLAGLAVASFIILIKSISKVLQVYNSPKQVEISAAAAHVIFELKQVGFYEIAVKRPGLFTAIPTQISFRLTDQATNQEIPVYPKFNLFGGRKNGSGDRVISIAEFQIQQTGKYCLKNLDTSKFIEKDALLLMPKTGFKGLFSVFFLVISAIIFIGSLVLSIVLITQNK